MKRFSLFCFLISIQLPGLAQPGTPFATVPENLRGISAPVNRPVRFAGPLRPEATPPVMTARQNQPGNSTNAINWIDEAVIGKTNFDIQTNGSISNRIVKNADGTISAVWTLSGQTSSYTDRGTGYNYFDPNTSSLWQKGWYNPVNGTGPGLVNITRTEGSYRTGYTNIIVTGSGKEMTVAHSSTSGTMLLNRRATKGTGAWTQYPNLLNNATGANYDTWSKGIADGDTIHLLWQGSGTSGLAVNGQSGPIFYSRSNDGGVTWPVLRTVIPAINNTQYKGFDADSYSIDAKNGTVVIVYGDFDTDVGILKSTDGGNTWTKKIVQRFPIPLYDPNTMSTDAYGPNGTGGPDGVADTLISNGADACALIDNTGMCHVWFSANRVYSRAPGAGLSYFPLTDGLYYWNESMPTDGYRLIARSLDMNNDGILNLPSGGACAVPYGYFDGGITQMPSAGIDTGGVLYVTYQSICELCDTSTATLSGTQSRRHVYIITSSNNGLTWTPPKDILPNIANGGQGENQEGVYACVARNVDTKVYVLYQRDLQPGNSVSIAGGCDQYNNTSKSDMVFAKVDAAYARNSSVTAIINVNTPIKCFGGSANLTLLASGGTPPYTGTGTYTRTAGTYSFTVTDAIGITSTTLLTLSQPIRLNASSSPSVIKCNGDSALITVQATGGVAPYTGTGVFKHVAGSYSYTVVDSNGCSATTSGTITQPSALNPVASAGVIACNGGSTTLTVTSTGGTTPYSGTGSYTVTAGSYSFLVTDANGCIDTALGSVSQPSVLSATATAGAINCYGGNSSVVVSATGGTLPYTGTGTFSRTAGSYSYIVTDARGCTANTGVVITQPSAMNAVVNTTASSTVGGTDGTASAIVSGGTAPYTYLWSNGNTTSSASTLSAGSYSVTITDANGCTASASGTVGDPNCIMSVSVTSTPIACYGDSSTITVTATNGSLPYSGTGTFKRVAGAYSFTVTDSVGCSITRSGTITQPSALSVVASAQPVLCNGGTTSLTVTGSGGTPPYSGSGTFIRAAGTYPLTITDGNGCSATSSSVISQPSPLIATAVAGTIACNGGTTSVSITAAGGVPPYTGTGLFSRNAGAYSYTVTDINGCAATASGTITQPALLIATAAPGTITCAGGTASVVVTASGGTAPYSGTGSFSRTAGIHSYVIIDARGCSAVASDTLLEPSPLTVLASYNFIACNGGSTTVVVTPSGGTAPYTGSGSFTRNAGTYSYTVSDANGCTATASGTINQPAVLVASSTWSPVRCYGGTTGVTVNASGGTTPYTGTGIFYRSAGAYSLNVTDANGCIATTTGSVTQPASPLTASGVPGTIACNGGTTTLTISATGGTPPYTSTGVYTRPAGNYTYTVTDANGCTTLASGTILQPSVLSATSTAGAIACYGGLANVTVSATGGTPPYQGTGIFQRTAGAYALTVTDANGCTSSTTGTITQPTPLNCTSNSGTIACNGGSTTVTVAASGGVGPYSGTGVFTASAGGYSYTVTDANGCTANTSGTLTQPARLVAAVQAGTIRCNGETTTITVSANGGTTPYNGTGSYTVPAGSYTYAVTDTRGCVSTVSATVSQPTALSVSATNPPILCNGGNTTLTVSGAGGTSPYTGTGNFTRSAGAYNYSVTDANGCIASALGNITQPALLTASASGGSIACFGNTAMVTITAAGGSPAYSGTGNFTRPAGSYSFTVSDANGCTATTNITLTQPASLSTTVTTVGATTVGGSNGSATTFPTGGTIPYQYHWSNGATTATAAGLTAGTYTVTVTDARGCTTTATGSVGDPSCNIILAVSGTRINCFGGSTNVNVSAAGGVPPYSGTGIFSRQAGPYSFTVTDSIGCSATISGTVTQPSALSAYSSAGNILCYGGTTTVNVTAGGGTTPYSGTGTFSRSAGAFTYTVTDANGCTSTTSGSITQPSALNVSSTTTPIACYGGTSTVTVNGTGGTPPYTGIGTFSRGAGAFSYTVTDASGCTALTSGVISQPSLLQAASTTGSIGCYGGTTTVTVSGSGGTSPYTGTGTYTRNAGAFAYIITDANGCTANVNGTISQPTVLSAVSSAGTIRCNGGTATITVSANGGTLPYTGTGNFIRSAGAYSFTVTDANGCTAVAGGTLNQPGLLMVSSLAGTIACYGGQTNVNVSASGGTPPYTGTGNFVRSAGGYSIAVTDSQGCVMNATGTITQPTQLTVSSSSGSIACNGGTTTITVSAAGGTPPYSGNGTFTVNAGSYSYTVSDANGCTSTTTKTISQPSILSVTSSSGTIGCYGGSATVAVNASGGTPPYSGTGTFSRTAGAYSFTVVDANGCSGTTNGTLNQPTALSSFVSTTPSSTVGGNNGTASASASGGTLPYSYSWSTGGTSSTIYNLTAGNYGVTVTDGNGCTSTASGTVGDPSCTMVLSVTGTSIACYGGNANVTVTASGGNPPYTGTGTFVRPAGNYSFVVTDNAGCTANISASVTQPGALSVTSLAGRIACFGGTTTVTVSASGGNSPYLGTGTFSVSSGNYSYSVTDANGCTATTSGSVAQPSRLSASSTHGSINCFGQATTVTVTCTGGTAPYTGTGTFSVGSGPYSYTVTDANGCMASTADSITQPTLLQAAAVAGTVACAGGTTQVNITASGGTAPYTGTGTYTRFAGAYTFNVTDLNGCIATASAVVTQPSLLSAYASTGSIACFGGTANVTVSALGGIAPYQGVGAFIRQAGPYSYAVTDANGCVATVNGTIAQPTPVQASVAAGQIPCNGGQTTVTVSATGGTPSYTGTGTFTRTAGSYSYTVTDANGCNATAGITLTQPAALNAASASTAIACSGGLASVVVSGSGGTSPYSGTGSFTVAAGAYSFTLTDANGCTATTLGIVSQPPLLNATSNANPIGCFGGSTTVVVGATGGTAPYTGTGNYSRTTGSYTFTVSDANGCIASTSIVLNEPPALSAVMSTTPTTTVGGSNGSASVLPAGGTSPFSYLWSNGSTASTANGLTSGNYSVTVTDANGCTTTASGTVGNPNCNVTVTVNESPILCNGGTSAVTVIATNGTAPYSGTGTFTRSAGPYSFTVTDNNGCTATVSGTLIQPTLLTSFSTSGTIRCYGGTTVVTVGASGGTPPYTGTGNYTRLAGNYSFTVMDANGCASTATGNVIQPNPLSVASSGGSISCFGSTTNLIISATGGAPPYTGTGVFPRAAGTYTFTVTDNNTCTQSAVITLSQPPAITVDAGTPTSVCGGNTVLLGGNPTASGGTGTLVYSWTPSQNLNSASVANPIAHPMQATTYVVTATDDNGCTATSSTTIALIGPDAPLFSVAPICNGEGHVSINNVNPSCYYSWSNGQTHPYVTVTDTGTYSVIISDSSGCATQAFVNVGTFNACGGILAVEADPFITVFDTLNVNVTIKNGVQIYSVFATLDFDSTLLTPVYSSAGNYFGPGSNATPVVNSNGHLSFSLSQSGGQASANGDGLIYSFRFAVSRMDSSLNFNPNSPDYLTTLFHLNNIYVLDTNSIQPASFNSISLDTAYSRIYYKVDVWPGDLNNDHVSNVADVLPIGYFYGINGPVRPSANTTWSAQPAPLWGFDLSSTNATAYRTFADANGDGSITAQDKTAIAANLGLQHARTSPLVLNPPQFNTLPKLNIELADTVVFTGSLPMTERATLSIGDLTQPVNDLYGVAFDVYFDPAFIDTTSITVDYTGSVFGTLNNQFLSVVDASAVGSGRLSIGMTRFNTTTVSGNGSVLATIEFPLTATAPQGWFSTQIEPLACNDRAGNPIALSGSRDSLEIIYYVSTPDGPEAGGVVMYPNPVTNQLIIRSSRKGIPAKSTVHVFNTIGQQIFMETIEQEFFTLPASRFTTDGIYTVVLKGVDGAVLQTRRIAVLRK